MKRTLLLSVVGLLMGLPLSARNYAFNYPPKLATPYTKAKANSIFSSVPLQQISTPTNVAVASDDTPYMELEKCDSSLKYVSYGFGRTDDLGMAVTFTAEELEEYIGCTITAINIVTPTNDLASEDKPTLINTLKKATVSIGETLEGAPVHSFEVDLGSIGSQWQVCELPAPYPIVAGKDLCFKVMFTGMTTRDHAWTVDMTPAKPGGAWVYSKYQSSRPDGTSIWQDNYAWTDMGPTFKLNNCLTARIEGDKLQQSMIIPLADDKGVSTIHPGEPFNYYMLFKSMGAEKVTNLEIEMEIEGQGIQTATATVERADPPYVDYIRFKEMGVATASFTCNREGGDIIYSARVTKVNGKPNEYDFQRVGDALTVMRSGFPRRLVCEEYTGTWCGWCPAGIAAFRKAKEVLKDRFIPIAVHSEDEMDMTAAGAPYETFVKDMAMTYAPAAVINRMTNAFDPDPATILEFLSYYDGLESFMDVKPRFDFDGGQDKGILTVDITASCEAEGDYGVAYVLLEDMVGPYVQINYFTGGSQGPMDGWEDSPEQATTLFNDVARPGSIYRPLASTSFTGLAQGGTRRISTPISLAGVGNVENCRIVAMVINNISQVIVNAQQLAYKDFGSASISATEANSAQPAEGLTGRIRLHSPGEIYTTRGTRIASGNAGDYPVLPGIYVVRGAWGVSKVSVK